MPEMPENGRSSRLCSALDQHESTVVRPGRRTNALAGACPLWVARTALRGLAYAATPTAVGGPVALTSALMRSGRVVHSTRCIRDEHFGHCRTSMANTRAKSCDHESLRCRSIADSGACRQEPALPMAAPSLGFGTTSRRSLCRGANTP